MQVRVALGQRGNAVHRLRCRELRRLDQVAAAVAIARGPAPRRASRA